MRVTDTTIKGTVLTRRHFCALLHEPHTLKYPLFANIVPINAANCDWPTDLAAAVFIQNPLLESKTANTNSISPKFEHLLSY